MCTVCAGSSEHTHKHTARPGQLGLDVNVQWSCEFLCELSQTHCIAQPLHMGPSCLLCASQLQPLQATGGYFCSDLVVLNYNLFRTTAKSEARLICALALRTVVISTTKKVLLLHTHT